MTSVHFWCATWCQNCAKLRNSSRSLLCRVCSWLMYESTGGVSYRWLSDRKASIPLRKFYKIWFARKMTSLISYLSFLNARCLRRLATKLIDESQPMTHYRNCCYCCSSNATVCRPQWKPCCFLPSSRLLSPSVFMKKVFASFICSRPFVIEFLLGFMPWLVRFSHCNFLFNLYECTILCF